MAGHQRVALPWWRDAGRFLSDFLTYLRDQGLAADRWESPGGGKHLWLYVALDPAHPEVSRIQFGTVHSQAAVHAYAWARNKYLPEAARLLRAFVEAWSARTEWRKVMMRWCACLTTGRVFFYCPEEWGLSFAQSFSAEDSLCGRWSLYYSSGAGDKPWFGNEDRKLFFFLHESLPWDCDAEKQA